MVPINEQCIQFLPVYKGQLFIKGTFSGYLESPLYTGLIVYTMYLIHANRHLHLKSFKQSNCFSTLTPHKIILIHITNKKSQKLFF